MGSIIGLLAQIEKFQRWISGYFKGSAELARLHALPVGGTMDEVIPTDIEMRFRTKGKNKRFRVVRVDFDAETITIARMPDAKP